MDIFTLIYYLAIIIIISIGLQLIGKRRSRLNPKINHQGLIHIIGFNFTDKSNIFSNTGFNISKNKYETFRLIFFIVGLT